MNEDEIDNCIFCKIAHGLTQPPVEFLAENAHAVVIRVLRPQAKAHVLAMPKEHTENIGRALRGVYSEAALAALQLGTEYAEKYLPDGYRIVTNTGADAGQAVKHLHFHVLGGEELKGI
jgi:histidine triad (HIT) family protein